MSKKLWFKSKRYGWGWTPASWEGWAVLAVYLILFVIIFRTTDLKSHSGSDTLYGITVPIFFLTVLLILVCYKTGEKPEWRWGRKK